MDIIQHPLWLYKRCVVCGVEKPSVDFPRNRKNLDGLHYHCRECHSARGKAWYAAHRAERLQYQNNYNDQHRSAQNEQKRWNRKNGYSAEYRNENRYRERRKAARQTRRAREHGGGKHTAAEWRALKTQHDNRCLCCGKQEPEITLQPDHVVPLALGGVNTIDNIQPLCQTCNLRKSTKHIDFRT